MRKTDTEIMLQNAISLKADVFGGNVNETSRTLAKILGVWLEASKNQLEYLRLREDGEVRKHKFFETPDPEATLDDADTVARIEAIYQEIEGRLSAH
jgi:hypothetical protein